MQSYKVIVYASINVSMSLSTLVPCTLVPCTLVSCRKYHHLNASMPGARCRVLKVVHSWVGLMRCLDLSLCSCRELQFHKKYCLSLSLVWPQFSVECRILSQAAFAHFLELLRFHGILRNLVLASDEGTNMEGSDGHKKINNSYVYI